MQEDLHGIRVPWILESIPDRVRVVRVRRVGGHGLFVVQGGRPVIRLQRDGIAPTRAPVVDFETRMALLGKPAAVIPPLAERLMW